MSFWPGMQPSSRERFRPGMEAGGGVDGRRPARLSRPSCAALTWLLCCQVRRPHQRLQRSERPRGEVRTDALFPSVLSGYGAFFCYR